MTHYGRVKQNVNSGMLWNSSPLMSNYALAMKRTVRSGCISFNLSFA